MNQRNLVKYKFSKVGASIACEVLKALANKRYLDRNGVVKRVKNVIITPSSINQLQTFLQEPNLLADYQKILEKYECAHYAIIFLLEAPDSRITNYTIEEFEYEFGLPSQIMEMVLDQGAPT